MAVLAGGLVLHAVRGRNPYNGEHTATYKGEYKDTVFFKKPVKTNIKLTEKTSRESVGDSYRLHCTIAIENLNQPKVNKNFLDDLTISDITGYEFSYPQPFSAAFDSKTGECLEVKNNHGVKFEAKDDGWVQEYYPVKSYEILGEKVPMEFLKSSKIEFTVTYPKKYHNLAIAAGFVNATEDEVEKDKGFWQGKGSYMNTTYYKKGKDTVYYLGFKDNSGK